MLQSFLEADILQFSLAPSHSTELKMILPSAFFTFQDKRTITLLGQNVHATRPVIFNRVCMKALMH